MTSNLAGREQREADAMFVRPPSRHFLVITRVVERDKEITTCKMPQPLHLDSKGDISTRITALHFDSIVERRLPIVISIPVATCRKKVDVWEENYIQGCTTHTDPSSM